MKSRIPFLGTWEEVSVLLDDGKARQGQKTQFELALKTQWATNLLRGGSPRILGGLFNKSCDSTGLRHVYRMATLGLNNRRACPF